MIIDIHGGPEAQTRPIWNYGAQYFARLTQRLISALSAQTNYGALYHVDMRLRPSGRAGPVATSLDAFASYQETEAWTWEHMALTRARVVVATPGFAEQVEAVIGKVLGRKRDTAVVAEDVGFGAGRGAGLGAFAQGETSWSAARNVFCRVRFSRNVLAR